MAGIDHGATAALIRQVDTKHRSNRYAPDTKIVYKRQYCVHVPDTQ